MTLSELTLFLINLRKVFLRGAGQKPLGNYCLDQTSSITISQNDFLPQNFCSLGLKGKQFLQRPTGRMFPELSAIFLSQRPHRFTCRCLFRD